MAASAKPSFGFNIGSMPTQQFSVKTAPLDFAVSSVSSPAMSAVGVSRNPSSKDMLMSRRSSTDQETSSTSARQQAGYERRLSWLEEDVSVLHRRLRDDCGDANGSVVGDTGLRALVSRLDAELASERRSREAMDARLTSMEAGLRSERTERETQLRGFSNELETTMRGLICRIDEGLSAGAHAMRERTDATEMRLRSLIERVDQGLSAGAAELQDTLSGAAVAAAAPAAVREHKETSRLQTTPQNTTRVADPSAGQKVPSADELIQSWDALRQENLRLRERRAVLHGQRSKGLSHASPSTTPSTTPSNGLPATMQVAGTGLAGYQRAPQHLPK